MFNPPPGTTEKKMRTKTKSYMDLSAQWHRLHKLTFRGDPYAVPEWRMKLWKIANKICRRYEKNIIKEYDRIHGYKPIRNLWEQFPASVYAK